jgi:hypothetical protein
MMMNKRSVITAAKSSIYLQLSIPLILFFVGLFISSLFAASEFPISTAVPNEQNWNTATDGTNFLVTWRYYAEAFGKSSVKARLVSAEGDLLGDELSISSVQLEPFLYTAYDGANYLIVWFEGTKAYAQYVTPSGSKLGDPFQLSATMAETSGHFGSYLKPTALTALAMGGSNMLLVAPSTRRSPSDYTYRAVVSGDLISKSSVNQAGHQTGTIFIVDKQDVSVKHVSVASGGSGYLAVWIEMVRSGTRDYNYTVHGRFISDSGEAGDEVLISKKQWMLLDVDKSWPAAVAADGDGYLVIWSKETMGGAESNIDLYGRYILNDGTLVGGEFPIANTTSMEVMGRVIFDGENYLVTWHEDFLGPNNTVKGRFISKDGEMDDTFTAIEKNSNGLPGFHVITSVGDKYFASITRGASVSTGIGYMYFAAPENVPEAADIYGSFLDLALPSGDKDSDGLMNKDETSLGTDPNNPDTDNDTLLDGAEVLTYKTDPNNPDTDNDTLLDGAEVLIYKTDPLKNDTDNDGLLDKAEIITYKTNPLKNDTDSDGLLDGAEVLTYKTDPLKNDTDGDCALDGAEIAKKTNPLNPGDNKCPCKVIGQACRLGTDCCSEECSSGKCAAAVANETVSEQSKSDSTTLLVGIVIATVIIAGVAAYLLLVKKPPAEPGARPPLRSLPPLPPLPSLPSRERPTLPELPPLPPLPPRK